MFNKKKEDKMKLLINFQLKPQGWSEIIDVNDSTNKEERKEAIEKAQKLLANRIINDGVKSIIEISAVTPINEFITKRKRIK
jgi:hypothetical protein